MTDEEREAIKAHLTKNQAYPGKDVFLDAVCFPWDDAPLGKKVISHRGEIGEVVGQSPVFAKEHTDCPHCTCTKINSYAGWWNIKYYGKWTNLEYPPNLKLQG